MTLALGWRWRILDVAIGVAMLAGCAGTGPGVPLRRAAAIPLLGDVCPPTRGDELCVALREGGTNSGAARIRTARQLVARVVGKRLATHGTSPWDPAVLLYIRERALGILAWYVISGVGVPTEMAMTCALEPANYERRVSEILAQHFPLYSRGTFPVATYCLPPQLPRCDGKADVLLILPGVARTLERNEFKQQVDVLRRHLKCLAVERVNTRSFMSPRENAKKVREVVAHHSSDARIHLLGYSQGGMTALEALTEDKAFAARVATVTFLNVPVHGSEVGEALYRAVRPARWFEWILPSGPLKSRLETAAQAFGGPSGDAARRWLQQEGAAEQRNVGDFLRQRVEGVRSLGTSYSQEFWARNAERIPRTPLYAAFRSIITKRTNLPKSNEFLYELTRELKPRDPYNDMQVRLASQSLGGSLGLYEVLGPVAEGNHWQWALVPDDVPDALMPRSMTEPIPHSELLLAYYTTFAEAGLLTGTAERVVEP